MVLNYHQITIIIIPPKRRLNTRPTRTLVSFNFSKSLIHRENGEGINDVTGFHGFNDPSFRGGKAVDRRSLRNKVVTAHSQNDLFPWLVFPRLEIHPLLESLRRSCRAKINDFPVFNEIVNYGDAPSVWKAAREILARKNRWKNRGEGMRRWLMAQLVRTKVDEN